MATLQERRRAWHAQFNGVRKPGIVPRWLPIPIPPHVQAERLRLAGLTHRTTTALLLGDPLPGRSMLDRKPASPSGIAHDPLDDLIFGRVSVL